MRIRFWSDSNREGFLDEAEKNDWDYTPTDIPDVFILDEEYEYIALACGATIEER